MCIIGIYLFYKMDQQITVPCKISFNSDSRDESTIKFTFEDIPLIFKFSALDNFGILPNGNAQLKLANLYVNDDKTICSLLDIRNYNQSGRFVPPSDRGEVIHPDQHGYEDNTTRRERIIREIKESSEKPYESPETLKLTTPFSNFIYIIKEANARVDLEELIRLNPDQVNDYHDYYYNDGYLNPENKISQILQKLEHIIRGGGKKKNGRHSCRTRYKAKRAKHSKSKKRYRKSKKRMLRS
jgi:hypothetical protein